MPKSESLNASISNEGKRLRKGREKAVYKKRQVEQEIEAIERELAAIEAYEKAKGTSKRGAKSGKAKRPAARRSQRGAKRAAVLEVVSQHPDGLSRGEILNLMGVKGDKSGEQSVSNALSALTKQNQLGKKHGKYVPATQHRSGRLAPGARPKGKEGVYGRGRCFRGRIGPALPVGVGARNSRDSAHDRFDSWQKLVKCHESV